MSHFGRVGRGLSLPMQVSIQDGVVRRPDDIGLETQDQGVVVVEPLGLLEP